MRFPTAEQIAKPSVQIVLKGPPAPPVTKCDGCGRTHPTRWEIACPCGQTIYAPFAERGGMP